MGFIRNLLRACKFVPLAAVLMLAFQPGSAGNIKGIGVDSAKAAEPRKKCDKVTVQPTPKQSKKKRKKKACLLLKEFFKDYERANARATTIPGYADIATDNFGALMQPGEPTLGGQMQKTIWTTLYLDTKSKVVVHTFGSEYDTVLAAYRANGPALSDLKRLSANDDFVVSGLGSASLVSFAANAGEEHYVQVGGKSGAEGDAHINVSVFPPTGGLSVFLAELDGFAYNNRDYQCVMGAGGTSSCPVPGFIVHNSTSKTLQVTATSNLGAGVVVPTPFSLAPGEAVLKTFTFSGFNNSTVRALNGEFRFTGKEGATTISTAAYNAFVIVKSFSQPDSLALDASPQVRAVREFAPAAFRMTLTNTGGATANDCFFKSQLQSTFLTRFQRINPSTGAAIGDPGETFDLAAGASATFNVWGRGIEDYVADPSFNGPITADCADTATAGVDLLNNTDFSSVADFEPASMVATRLSPASDVLQVSAGGKQNARFSVVNRGATQTLKASAAYIRPFGESDPASQFGVKICRTATATGACLASPAAAVNFKALAGSKYYFRMTVTGAANDPGFDPGARRAYIQFEKTAKDGLDSYLVGVASVAVKRN